MLYKSMARIFAPKRGRGKICRRRKSSRAVLAQRIGRKSLRWVPANRNAFRSDGI